MMFSLYGQYWNKDDSFENIKDSVLLMQENMQHVLNYEIVQNVGYAYKVVIFIKYLFYHVGDQEMIKQTIS